MTSLGKHIAEHVLEGSYIARQDIHPWAAKELFCYHEYCHWVIEQRYREEKSWSWLDEDPEES